MISDKELAAIVTKVTYPRTVIHKKSVEGKI